jgi:hypothetical protein
MLVHILTGLHGTRIGLDVFIAFYCFILRHDWVSLLFCAWDQQLWLCSGSLRGCSRPAGGADGNRPFGSTWSYPPKMLSAERTPWRGSANFLSRSDDLSLARATQVFFMLFRSFQRHRMCLSYLNIFDTFAWNLYESVINPREWCKLLKPFCIVSTCFNMFHSWLRWQKHNWPGQDDNGIINSGGIGQSEPQPFQGNQETFCLKKRTFSVPWQVWRVNTILSREAWKTCPILLTSFRSSRHERGFWKGPTQCLPPYPSISSEFAQEFMWYIRRRPPVMRAFANLWGVSKEDLLVSFDGCCAFRPPAVDVRPGVKKSKDTQETWGKTSYWNKGSHVSLGIYGYLYKIFLGLSVSPARKIAALKLLPRCNTDRHPISYHGSRFHVTRASWESAV